LRLWNMKFLKNDEFKPKLETQNDFNIKSDENQSCSNHQDLQICCWPFLNLTKFECLKFEIFQKWQVWTKIWDTKWFQHKKWWIPKLFNSSRSTNLILTISSFDKIQIFEIWNFEKGQVWTEI
jgi:hypothetical protein